MDTGTKIGKGSHGKFLVPPLTYLRQMVIAVLVIFMISSLCSCAGPEYSLRGKPQVLPFPYALPIVNIQNMRPGLIWAVEKDGETFLCVEYNGGYIATGYKAYAAKDQEYVRYRLSDGKAVERGTWSNGFKVGGASDGTILAALHVTKRRSAINTPFAWLHAQDRGKDVLVRLSSFGLKPLRQFSSSYPVFLGKEHAIIGVRGANTGLRIRSVIRQCLIVHVNGKEQSVPLPPQTDRLMSNGSTIVALRETDIVAIDRSGKVLWTDKSVMPRIEGVGPTVLSSQGVGAREYFVVRRASGFEIRRFDTGETVTVIDDTLCKDVHCVGNVVAVRCLPDLAAKKAYPKNRQSQAYRDVRVYADGKHIGTISGRASTVVVLQSDEYTIVGAEGWFTDIETMKKHEIKGRPVMLVKEYMITYADRTLNTYNLRDILVSKE